ncbi:MAG: ATP-binding cassette domain-containing protein, partial [Rhodobiaceae bacterium]|nr:ATP-binding cassette domain-containing protein [Rhodobiaceae bacterium]
MPQVEFRNVVKRFGRLTVLDDLNLRVEDGEFLVLLGPSGCGKSTLLRTLNRMNDIIEGTRHTGDVLLEGTDIFDPRVDVVALRKRVGMVFQKSTPFP